MDEAVVVVSAVVAETDGIRRPDGRSARPLTVKCVAPVGECTAIAVRPKRIGAANDPDQTGNEWNQHQIKVLIMLK